MSVDTNLLRFGVGLLGVAIRLRHWAREWLRALGWALAAAVLASLALACASELPELLRVEKVVPSAVEEHDTLVFSGEGFVPNAKARVRFHGQLFRRGVAAEELEFTAEGRGIDTFQVEVPVTHAFASQFGAAESGHSTFRGSIEIAFRPARVGAPPVSGRIDAAVLDVYAGRDAPSGESIAGPSGVSLEEFLGAQLHRTGVGLTVNSVTQGGRAARAGLQVEDRIVVFGGLNVRTIADLQPHSGQRQAALGFRRAGSAEVSNALIDVADFAPRSAQGWLWGLATVGACGLLLLALRGPLGELLSAIEASQYPTSETLQVALRPKAWKVRRISPRGLPAFVAVSLLFVLVSTRVHFPAAEVDTVWLCLLALVLLTSAALTAGGIDRSGVWSWTRSCLATVQQFPVQFALGLVIFAVGVDRGSLSLVETAARQGAAPWEFYAFTSPVGFLGATCLGASVVLTRSFAPRFRSVGNRTSFVALLGRSFLEFHWLLVAALLVAVFLGGWQAPAQLKSVAPATAGMLAFQAKFAFVYALGAFLRERLPELPAGITQRVAWRWMLPVSAGVPLLVPIWAAEVWPAWLRTSCGALFLIFTVLLAAVVVARLKLARPRVALHASLNPWL